MFIFEISGAPAPQKQTQWTRTGIAYDPSRKNKEFIQWQIKPHAPEKPLDCPIEMHITFYLPIPKSTSAVKRRQMINGVILPKVRPDVDNLAYLVTNALKKIVYNDDSLITDLHIHKRYGETPKTVIKIIPIEELSPLGGARCA
jgi:Holliday junction resolvase RusA-like endonuclease